MKTTTVQETVDPRRIPVACFAPPLTDELLEEYKAITTSAPSPEIRYGMEVCLRCVEAWYAAPLSSKKPLMMTILHKDSEIEVPITKFEDGLVEQLWEATPFPFELDAIQKQFDEITDKKLRDAAFHLLWYAKEIAHDREPMTLELLPS